VGEYPQAGESLSTPEAAPSEGVRDEQPIEVDASPKPPASDEEMSLEEIVARAEATEALFPRMFGEEESDPSSDPDEPTE
jgi:hypothetical protein